MTLKISMLTYAAGLEAELCSKLKPLGLTAYRVDYNKPIRNQISNSDILINGLGQLDRQIIDFCPKLRLVQQIGTGVDNVDVSYCASKSIYVANVPHVNNISVAEHTIFLMIYLAKNIKGAEKGIKERRVVNVLGTELYNKTMVIIGLGAIGIEVAKRAKAFGMNVISVTKRPELRNKVTMNYNTSKDISTLQYCVSECLLVDEIKGITDLKNTLGKADVVSIHTPLTLETKNMIGRTEFARMKRSSFLINVSRASIVNKDALYNALTSRTIAGAGFDVFYEEPANPIDKLLNLDNFVYTPHIAGWTLEATNTTTDIILNNINLLLHGRKPLTVIN
ncbi:NAD(P)-dependent oxidoreductase [Candidatus Nitrosocosmicus oleophilus]|nr:NAD(P)-dependent oxidoreductase [Candidatus Nitrosocosmicus oleophilus]